MCFPPISQRCPDTIIHCTCGDFILISPIGQRSDDKPGCVPEILVAVPELGVADVRKAVELLLVPSANMLSFKSCRRCHCHCCHPSYPVYIASIHIDLCLSWDCQAKAALDSTFLLTTSILSICSNTTSTYLIIPPTTSRECTSIVQIVITWWLK